MKRNHIWAVVVLVALLAWGVVDAYVLDTGAENAATSEPGSVPIGLKKATWRQTLSCGSSVAAR